MKMKVDLSKFKLKSKDDKIATLMHPDGHEFRVAIHALHPENRKNLENLAPHEPVNNMAPKSPKMADGGKVDYEPIQDDTKVDYEAVDDEPKQPVDYESIPEEPKKYADGGEADDSAPSDNSDEAPVTVNVNNPEPGAGPQGIVPEQPATPMQAAASQEAAVTNAQQTGQAPTPAKPLDQQPSVMGGYKETEAGIYNTAKAEAAQAQVQAQQAKINAGAHQQLADEYHGNVKDINDEIDNTMQDIRDQHINPNHYLGSKDTGQKIATGIGLILGGMGAGLTGGSNQALDFLNRNIDRDIEAQKANLGKSETLLSANMKRFQNATQATDMTRVIMTAHAADQMQQKALETQSPIIKARAQQMAGQLQMQNAPIIQQMAMRQMLLNPNSNLQGQDPAKLVPYVVPPAHQAKAFSEIERAENTRKAASEILKNYDEVTRQYQAAGGLGRVVGAIYHPRELDALQGLLGSTVTDLTGSARQAEFENIKNSYHPRVTDTEHGAAVRRQGLVDYLNNKSSSPVASGSNIDLDRFASTSTNPEARLTPQQKSFVEFARKNPNDPRSAMILKKLGIQ